jgi:putative acetyltransferase
MTGGIDVPFPVPDEALMVAALVEGALEGVHGIVRYPHAFDVSVE